ncbi:MAG: RNA 2',3'-cyclic phosphodiesterase [Actinobacteria bacterium]|nr:RNA 2',3'-cyclic phosphodiesterase [Actinomycetota bacterium]
MAKEVGKGKRVRLFVALDLPATVRAGIGAWGERELADPALRRVREDSLHVTFAFLGSREEGEVESVVAAVRAGGDAPAPLLELLDPVQRPPRGRARLFALPVLSAGAEQMQAAVAERLVEAGLYELEKRPFWPHVTVARSRSERGSQMVAERPPGELPEALREPFYGVRLTLYRSQLQPTGARYAPLAQVELPGAGGSEVI